VRPAASQLLNVVAGLAKNPTSLPKWWGTVDATLAFVVAVGALGIQVLARENVDKQAEQTTYRIDRGLIHAILAVGVLVRLASDRINWAKGATGFLWRTWLLLYILRGGLPPHAAQKIPTLMRSRSSKPEATRQLAYHPKYAQNPQLRLRFQWQKSSSSDTPVQSFKREIARFWL